MLVEVKQSPQATIIKIKSKVLDASNTKLFRMELMKLYEQGKRNFIIDFSDVRFIDSSGIGALLSIYKVLGSEGSLCFCCVDKDVNQILQMVNLSNLFTFYATVEEATKRFPANVVQE